MPRSIRLWVITTAAIGGCANSAQIRGNPAAQATASIGDAVVREHSEEVAACIEPAAYRAFDLRGRVSYEAHPTEEGRVRELRIRDSTISDPELADCLEQVIYQWRFPVPTAPVVTLNLEIQPPWVTEDPGGDCGCKLKDPSADPKLREYEDAVLWIARVGHQRMKPCHAAARARGVERPGVRIVWEISETGEATNPVIDARGDGNPDFETCVIAAVRQWLFPRPPPGAAPFKTTFGWVDKGPKGEVTNKGN